MGTKNLRRNAHRSTKVERQRAQEVLRGIWQTAYRLGEWQQAYDANGKDGEIQASKLYHALADYRKKIRDKQTAHFDIFVVINACSLVRTAPHIVTVRRKPHLYSERTSILLDIANNRPELGLVSKSIEPNLETILNDFKKA